MSRFEDDVDFSEGVWVYYERREGCEGPPRRHWSFRERVGVYYNLGTRYGTNRNVGGRDDDLRPEPECPSAHRRFTLRNNVPLSVRV